MAKWLKHSTTCRKRFSFTTTVGVDTALAQKVVLKVEIAHSASFRGDVKPSIPGGLALKGSASPGPRNSHHRAKSKLKITCNVILNYYATTILCV